MTAMQVSEFDVEGKCVQVLGTWLLSKMNRQSCWTDS